MRATSTGGLARPAGSGTRPRWPLTRRRRSLRGAENELSEARNARAIIETKIEGLEGAARLLAEELDAFVADDVEAARLIAADPGTLANRWKKRVEEFLAREKDRDAASAEIGRLEPAASAENAHLKGAESALAGKEKREAELGAAVEELRKDRGGLLDGLAVNDVTRALEAAVKKAEEDQVRASDVASRASVGTRRRVEALAGATEAGRKAAEKAEAARALRDAALSGLGLPAAGEGTGAGIAAAVAADALLRSEAEESLRQVDAMLLADHRTQEDRRVAVEEREKAEREGRVWLSLRDLIGEAQGGKFRKFAQGLTLEALVKSANQHLEDFARRYRLMQAPGTEVGLLVVDRDMGDEVRSVESLSGGESFLVSLALALGLASLATRRDRDRLALHRRGLRVARRRHSRPGGRGARRDPRRRPPDRRHLARPGAGREDRGPGEGRRPRGRPERGAGRRRVGPTASDIAIETSADKYA